jgi:hypothetical protein
MNFTESFDQFSSRVTTTDLALYAGIGIVLWVLFKDKLSPVQKFILGLVNRFNSPKQESPVPVKVPEIIPVVVPKVDSPKNDKEKEDVFFKLVVSWKQTRDLAEQLKCEKALEAADNMFPFLSPKVCDSKNNGEQNQ